MGRVPMTTKEVPTDTQSPNKLYCQASYQASFRFVTKQFYYMTNDQLWHVALFIPCLCEYPEFTNFLWRTPHLRIYLWEQPSDSLLTHVHLGAMEIEARLAIVDGNEGLSSGTLC